MSTSFPSAEDSIRSYVPGDDVPRSVTLRQFKLALLDFGFYETVDAAARQSSLRWIYWMSPGDVEWANDFVVQMAVGLGIAGETLAAIFRLAGTK